MDFHKEDNDIIRGSRSQMFSKIGALKKFAIFTGKRLCWSLFLIKLLDFRPGNLFKRDSQASVFLCAHCENFKYTFFYRTPLVAAFLASYCFSYVSYLARQLFLNLTFSFGKKHFFDLFSDVLFSYFLIITRL